MGLDWTTFILELVNFLVLVWLLKRFLYKPVLDIIERRRAGIDQTLADAKALNAEAEALRSKYEGRVEAWEAEKQRAMEALGHEVEAERGRRLAALQAELDGERAKAAAAAERRAKEDRAKLEAAALEQGAHFAARLLETAASAEVERRLTDLFLQDFEKLPAERLGALRAGDGDGAPGKAVVASAFELPADDAERVRAALRSALGNSLEVEFHRDTALGAGLSVTIGAWVLGLNLRDELEGFARLGDAE